MEVEGEDPPEEVRRREDERAFNIPRVVGTRNTNQFLAFKETRAGGIQIRKFSFRAPSHIPSRQARRHPAPEFLHDP